MSFKKIRIPLLIGLLIMAAVSGWMMYTKWQEEILWGYLPLWFFIGLWGAIVLMISHFSKKEDHLKLLGFSTLAGILLSLGFPPIPLTTLMFIGFVPLLMAEKVIADAEGGKKKRRVFFYSYNTFVVWNILTTYWVANTAFFAGIFAIWVNSLFMSIPFLLFHMVKKRMPNLAFISFVTFWLTFEYLHLAHELSWPWLTLGNSLAEFPSWAQWYEYTGVFGGSVWILCTNVLFYKLISNYYFNKISITLKSLIKPTTLLLIPILASLIIYFNHEEKGAEIEVAVVQPNLEPHYERDSYNKGDQYKLHTILTQKNTPKSVDYIIFPESSFDNLDEKNISKNRLIRDLRLFLNPYKEGHIIAGVGSYRFFEEGEELTPAIREYINKSTGKVSYYEAYNTAIQFSNFDEEVQIYHKSKLVPGAEFFPLKKVLPFMKPLVDKLGGSVAGLGMQAERTVFTGRDGAKLAPVICYESIYGSYTAGYVRNGANALVIMTNDGWWDDTAGHKQHLKFASLRAIETRRAIARAANTGISGFIDQKGKLFNATKYDEMIAISDTIQLNNELTFYTRYGDLIARVALFLSALLLLNLIAKSWKARVEKQSIEN